MKNTQQSLTQPAPTTLPNALADDTSKAPDLTKDLPKPKPKEPQVKPMPQEIKILLDGLEEIEGAIYATRQRLWQLYGTMDYSRVEDIELKFTEEQAKKLDFVDKGAFYEIYPKLFLGSELFAQINNRVRELNGEYVSAGKDSHWKIKRS